MHLWPPAYIDSTDQDTFKFTYTTYCDLHFVQQVGRAKEKAQEADKKRKKTIDRFVSFVRSAEGLYASTTWQEFEEAFAQEEEFVAVSCYSMVLWCVHDISWQAPAAGEAWHQTHCSCHLLKTAPAMCCCLQSLLSDSFSFMTSSNLLFAGWS